MTNQVIVKEILLSAPSAIPGKSKKFNFCVSAGIENILNNWRILMAAKYFIKVYYRHDVKTGQYIPYLKTWFEDDGNGNLIFKQEDIKK